MAIELTPSARPTHIAELIEGVDRYNPSNCHLLEDYLKDQLSTSTYDLLSNLALLKLYQFNPTLLSPSATLSILFISLAHAPFSPDFNLAWSLLSDSFVVGAALPPLPPTSDDEGEGEEEVGREPAEPKGEKETAERLHFLSGLLQARKFKLFWKTLRGTTTDGVVVVGGGGEFEETVKSTVEGLLKTAVGFEEVLRESIAKEVESSFRGLSKIMLASFLGLEPTSPHLATLAEKHHWTLEDKVAKFPSNESNSPTSSLQREHIEIEQLGRLLGKSQLP